MTNKDVVFRVISEGKLADPNSFCHYGWEGTGSFAMWKYATAYFDSAEILFEKFKASAGHNDILDGTGITMCFLYRHFVELSIKHLYVKFACSSKDDYKTFLENGHNLYKLWHTTKPKLSELRRRVGSSVDIGILEHYIMEFDRFDKDAMTMRYPVKNDLSPMNKPSRLDIINLHERVNELYWAFEGIANDLDSQLDANIEQEKVDTFLTKYDKLRDRMKGILVRLEPLTASEETGFRWLTMKDINSETSNGMRQMKLLKACPDDELIMLDTLYYTGRAIAGGELNLPKNPHEAKTDAVKMCIINMMRDHQEFGKPNNGEINVWSKMASSIIKYVSETIRVIDWDKMC